MLILRVLKTGPLHGYAIAQRIHQLSSEVLAVEEGSLYPALQRLLRRGLVKANWVVSDTSRRVRCYQLTGAGRERLEAELAGYDQVSAAIRAILRLA